MSIGLCIRGAFLILVLAVLRAPLQGQRQGAQTPADHLAFCNFHLKPGQAAVVRGVVRYAGDDGEPLPNASLRLVAASLEPGASDRTVAIASADERGCFEFAAPPGVYTLKTTMDQFLEDWTDVDLKAGSIEEQKIWLSLAGGGGIEVQHYSSVVELWGRIARRSGESEVPVAGAELLLIKKGLFSEKKYRTVTDDTGHFQFKVPSGKCTLRVTEKGQAGVARIEGKTDLRPVLHQAMVIGLKESGMIVDGVPALR